MSETEGAPDDGLPAWADEWPSVVAGDRVESEVVQLHPLEYVPDSQATWHDARTTTALFPRDDLPMAGTIVVERDTPVEIKGVQPRVGNGDGRDRRGRWLFQRGAHDRLVQERGVYLLAVYAPRRERGQQGVRVVAQAIIQARAMDDLLADSWYEAPASRSEGLIAKKSWSACPLFDIEAIEQEVSR